ncbi:MAG: hypothetical protein LC749_15635, partial [Actinobacteria bacterium]|nr:hypothetical protein [Actinomycetota bacterium]
AAHIVASSRQGPRGGIPLSDDERDTRASNRILFCPTHHTEVDKQPLVYTVEVLRQMKKDHERRHRKRDPHPAIEVSSSPERLQSSLLPVIGLPVVVESASVLDPKQSEGEIASSLKYPNRSREIVFPFIVRDGRLWTFSHLRQNQHPFRSVIDTDVEEIDVLEMAATDEGHRRVAALLNRAIGRHLGMQGVRFDREHQRYWLMANRDYDTGEIFERSYRYTTKTGRSLDRPVVHHAHRRTGEPKNEWYHEAARLRFERFGPGWFLAVRPEFHVTVDGVEPLPSHRIGRKVTRKKSHIYNDGYLDRLWFWKHFLSKGGPRLTIKTGEQSVLVDAVYATTEVRWPGVPGDALDVKNEQVDETLFTITDLMDEEGDESWWDDDEEDEH